MEELTKWFGTTEEKTILIQTMINNKEIAVEEAWQAYSEMIELPHHYLSFLQEFQELTGTWLIRGSNKNFTFSTKQ